MGSSFSRRSFMGAAAGLAAALRAKAAEPAFAFPMDARHRLSVSTYPFRDFIAPTAKHDAKALTLAEFGAAIPENFGVFGIEPWSRHFTSTEPNYVSGLRAAFDRAKLQVVNIPCDVNVRACGTPAQRQDAQRQWRAWVDIASALGSPSIRVHVELPKTGDFVAEAVDALKRISDYGAGKGIVINLENDDPRSEDPSLIVKILDGVKSPWVRSLPDFCNSMFIKNDENYNANALASLFPRAYNISHVKDKEVGDGKVATVELNRLFGVAQAAGYKGFFSMEYEGGADPYEGSSRLIADSLRNLGS